MAPPITRTKIPYSKKLEIVQAIERGEKKAHLARKYGVNESTIRTVYKNKNKIRQVVRGNPTQATLLHSFKVANPVLKSTEKVLARYVRRQNRHGVPIDGTVIRHKAKALYKEVARKMNVADPPNFKASRGWSFNFLKRHSLRSVKLTGEAASADLTSAQEFPCFAWTN